MSSAFRMAHTVWVRQSANGDCVISIEYYLELLNHVSENWEVLAPIIIQIERHYVRSARTSHF